MQQARNTSGVIVIWGSGEHGQHGHSHKNIVDAQEGKDCSSLDSIICQEQGIKSLSCGSSHTVVVTNANNIYVWGNGQHGQLGCGDQETKLTPTRINLLPLQDSNPDIQGVSCGSRQTFIWLVNGNVFSFGNNFYAQLGYDFRIKNYKDNQFRPQLLRTLLHRPVQHVACGNRHTMMLFRNGQVGCVGNGAYGQIGDGSRMEAVVPKIIEDFPAVVFAACGTFHCLVIDVYGMVWMWGYGPACGNKAEDIVTPTQVHFRHNNVICVAGGTEHSAALTKNGNVYTWGRGLSGELGHGEGIGFLRHPRRLKFPELRGKTVKLTAVEGYTAAVNDTGRVYMWGKNSHVIFSDQLPNFKVWTPQLVGAITDEIEQVFLGAWHSVAVTGKNDWQKCDDQSDLDNDDDDDVESETQPTSPVDVPEEPPQFAREKTSVTIAEFYAESTCSERKYPVDDNDHSDLMMRMPAVPVQNHQFLPRNRPKLTSKAPVVALNRSNARAAQTNSQVHRDEEIYSRKRKMLPKDPTKNNLNIMPAALSKDFESSVNEIPLQSLAIVAKGSG